MTNADMRVVEVRQFYELDEAGQQLIKSAMARTIADLAEEENTQSSHLAEALQYRQKGIMI